MPPLLNTSYPTPPLSTIPYHLIPIQVTIDGKEPCCMPSMCDYHGTPYCLECKSGSVNLCINQTATPLIPVWAIWLNAEWRSLLGWTAGGATLLFFTCAAILKIRRVRRVQCFSPFCERECYAHTALVFRRQGYSKIPDDADEEVEDVTAGRVVRLDMKGAGLLKELLADIESAGVPVRCAPHS